MAVTLFDRLIKLNLPINPDPSEQPIAILGFRADIREWDKGYQTAGEVVAWHDLTDPQKDEALNLRNLYQAALDKSRFMDVFIDWLHNGEIRKGVADGELKFITRNQLILRLESEVEDQGGVVPARV